MMNIHVTVQVPRSPELNQILDRFQHKLTPLLFVFHPDLVQLQGRLQRHTSREGVHCRLTLHLPTGQLSSERTAATAQTALRGAGDELIRQLNKHKQRLRETRPRFHRVRAARLRPRPGANAHAGATADLAAYLGHHYAQLLAFVQRQLELRERLGEIPEGWLEPAEILNEVVTAALSEPPQAASQNRGRWLLLLTAQAIRQAVKTYGEHRHGLQIESLEPDAVEALAGDEANPEESAAAVETMDRLAAALRPLPLEQRHDLVLYLLEGFRPQELARLTRREESEVRASLTAAEAALQAVADLPGVLRRQLPLDQRPPRRPARTKRGSGILPQQA
jgi:DNA-directed RNA polymerase specialized sigma24 family protein/ribosome-associated translation inhibitor RaiA